MMQFDIKYLILLILFVLSCKPKDDKLILSEEVLQKVVFDIHTAEFIINRTPADLKDSLNEKYLNQIMEIHQISKEDFLHDMEILKNDPERLKEFYEKTQKASEDMISDEKDKLDEYRIL